MSVLHIDGFDWVPSTSVQATLTAYLSAAGWYATTNNGFLQSFWPTATAAGRFGFGTAVRFGASLTSNGGPFFVGIARAVSTAASSVVIACSAKRLSTSMVNGAGGSTVGFYNSSTGRCVLGISLSPQGVVRTWTCNSGLAMTQLVPSSAGVFNEDVWFSLQVKATPHLTNGEVEVRVNNRTVISVVSTQIDSFDCICLGTIQGPGLSTFQNIADFDDLYILDSAGAVHNNFLGNLRVKTQVVIADGSNLDSSIGGTSPAATHWQSVNIVRTDDSKYVYSPTNGDYDLYDLDANQTGPYARAVQVRVVARQDDATQRTIKAALKTTTTLSLGTLECYLNQNYSHWTDIWQVSPDTGTDFTTAELNALEAGFEVHS